MAKRAAMVMAILGMTGCASAFMAGSAPHTGVPEQVVARYRVPTCQFLSNGNQAAGPADQIYYLTETNAGPVLYELDGRGKGAAISNHWVDKDDDHFLTYVKTSHGWEYVIPKDHSKPADRLVYVHGTFHVSKVDDVLKVTTGEPQLRCPMIPMR